ncbi:MAG TPA: LemA family protein [Bacteroidia bacterium]|nr:LemA family protein [Bacteroidia bacterium]HQO87292.1 LemA family protein [Bacteroidia bacterium]
MTALIILIVVLAIVAFYFISVYNTLVTLKNKVQEAWSSIDVMLKKRNDLIPNLIETVKGYAAHERNTLDSVTQARTQSVNAKTVGEQKAAEENMNKAMMNLFAVAEQYPDLKANTNFINLQQELSAIEGDIEKSRRYYNGTARDNNIAIESFPSNIVANMFQFNKVEFFELSNESEREVPKVKF